MLTIIAAFLALIGTLILWLPQVMAADVVIKEVQMAPEVWTWGLMAAALSTGISSLAAAYAVASVASAGIGALAEKPELFGRLIIFVGLAEGIAIYGLIVSVLIINSLK
ncbi:MAG: H+transporting two-sector ATPase C subunit [Gammaproteobacteria bacterium]|nr:H+transporting two-sector ATPase C subunit [Gammaproteobacteria bacterium]